MILTLGDCLDVLRSMESSSADSIVTDPPYGLSFMGKKWDYDVPSVDVWRECLRVLKPGGHALIACGTRTQHRMAVNIEDAGFEIRDVITWLYGSGFPKSLDVSKAIDKAAGAEREIVDTLPRQGFSPTSGGRYALNSHANLQEKTDTILTAPATEAAKQWQGWGTALKPACEFWTLARKPLGEKTVAANVQRYGTGGINVDGCRVRFASAADEAESKTKNQHEKFESGPMTNNVFGKFEKPRENYNPPGRFPANLILDEESSELLGDPARFFYTAKASKGERGEDNSHPCVKPIKLMRYLCRLITPPGGLVLDPFMGSGSTGVAALEEGFKFLGIEREEQYLEIANKRINSVKK